MNILIITNLYEPDFCGGAALFTDLANGLAARGHNVTVYAAYPYYPEWQDKSGENGLRIHSEPVPDGNSPLVLRHGLFVPKNPGKLIPRVAYELSFFLSLLRSLFRGKKQDAVLVFCPMFGSVLFALCRKWLRREQILLTVQDIPADAASASGISKSRLFDRCANLLQSFVFNRMSAWSSINQGMVDRLDAMKRTDIPLHFFPNWLTGPLADSVKQVLASGKKSPSNKVQLLYCGNIGKKQGLLDFCKLLQASDCEFDFQIRGEGAAANEVKTWVEEVADSRFRMSGFLNDDEFIAAIANADWFVITEKAGAGFSFIPSKLIPCISVGTPILSICDKSGPLGKEVSDHNLGISLNWNEAANTADHFQQLYDRGKWQALRQSCLDRATIYQRDTAISNYEQALSQVAEN